MIRWILPRYENVTCYVDSTNALDGKEAEGSDIQKILTDGGF